MAALPPNVKYFSKSTFGYPSNDDVAALRLIAPLVGTAANKGPLWVYRPSQLLTTNATDFTGAGRATMPVVSQQALALWEAAYADAVNSDKNTIDWIRMVNVRAGLNAAPAYNSFTEVDPGIQLSSSTYQVESRRALWGRLKKYGAVYGINPMSMARALATHLTSMLIASHTGASFLMAFDNNGHAVAPAGGKLTDANLASVWDTKGAEIYALMIGAPPFLDPSVFPDVNTIPVDTVYRPPRTKKYRKSRKKRRYY